MKILKINNQYFVRIENREEIRLAEQKGSLAYGTSYNHSTFSNDMIQRAYYVDCAMKTLYFDAFNETEEVINIYKEVFEDIEFKDISDLAVDKDVLVVCGGKSIHVIRVLENGKGLLKHSEDNIHLSGTELIELVQKESTLAIRF